MTYFNFDKLENLKDGDILFFDELLNGNPVVLNACLTILEQRRFISGKKLPNIMIIAAANPQGMTPITPQIKERFVWYKTKFDRKMWQDFMNKKYKMPNIVSSKLCSLIEHEDFNSNNFFTPRSIDKATSMLINNIPTPYTDEIESILDTIINNKLKEEVKLPNGEIIGIGESITWLKLIRIDKNIKIENFKEELNDIVKDKNENEILILNEKDEIIGEIKNIEILKTMYYFNAEKLINLRKGKKITPSPPSMTPNPRLFFQKK